MCQCPPKFGRGRWFGPGKSSLYDEMRGKMDEMHPTSTWIGSIRSYLGPVDDDG